MGIFGNTKELNNKIKELESSNAALQKEVEELRREKEIYVNAYNELWWKNKELTDGSMICHSCYKTIRKDYYVCPYCGTEVVHAVSSELTANASVNMTPDTSLFETEDDKDGCLIVRYNGFNEHKIIIPSRINGKNVIGIGDSVFENYKPLRTLVFEEGCRYIGNDAFAHCENLYEVHLPDSLREIGDRAFHSCQKIEKIIVPNNVTVLGSNVFNSCKNLKRIVLSDKLTYLPYGMVGHTGIETCFIPPSVLYIESSVFSNTKLTEIELPVNLLTIGDSVFENCRNLKKIIMHSNIRKIGRDILKGTPAMIYCAAGSEAQHYARNFNINAVQIARDQAFTDDQNWVHMVTISRDMNKPFTNEWKEIAIARLRWSKAAQWCIRGRYPSYSIDINKDLSMEEIEIIQNRLRSCPVKVSYYKR